MFVILRTRGCEPSKKMWSNKHKRLESKSRKNIFVFDYSRFCRTSIIFLVRTGNIIELMFIVCDKYLICGGVKTCERLNLLLCQSNVKLYQERLLMVPLYWVPTAQTKKTDLFWCRSSTDDK